MPTQIRTGIRPTAGPAARAVLAALLAEGETTLTAAPAHRPEAVGALLLTPRTPAERPAARPPEERG
ncbi:hypothetical protein ACIRBX_15500 [Kitasatospora sp. NPDC096147]|uniref:hypothetical protein n=1 Tax=Kitasatospora sp. NPDC096147 TaxID=3364093 RepID=UPI00382C7D33